MIEEKIKQLGFELPKVVKPLAAYIPAKKVGNLVMTSGQVPIVKGEMKFVGKVGKDLSEEDGQKAAQVCALNCLAAIKSVIGSLDDIEEVVKLTVFVNSADGFTAQPKVANGASELIGKIFGDNGLHVRSAVGVNELPLNAAVEIEMIVRVK
ncbi:Putative YjgF family translation initiation inhibitor [Ignavibacterium album JCM 16511]|uniref:Putative YjgF family translation initiation inhibitor n=1 Tax=Ignavibacterium album (strain DSM 19864 / JCM 16511 / NBRC 101810 / Mat9-16) TaxID=945713 RepID=I0AHS3_IGNAJ|nr:RidA family protein [Ignavibacterium album]AFH48530.1 Putative YjgF family translation initiation inhibitor [Ignavibacterium album JCM 16511]